jgi:hypothetical protein
VDTLSLHDALPIYGPAMMFKVQRIAIDFVQVRT